MLSKIQAKVIQSLRYKKFRQKYDLFVVEGEKILQTLLSSDKYEIDVIYYTQKASNFINNHPKINQVLIDERQMKSISFLNSPSSCLALVKTLRNARKSWQRAIYLDGVQDPGNMGTIIRTADWFGIDTIIRSSDSADFYNPKVVQSTMGAFANVNFMEIERQKLIDEISSNIYVADMNGIPLKEIESSEFFTLVVGSEGQGVHSTFQKSTVTKITIPGSKDKLSESLNVSIAAGLIANHLTSPFQNEK